MPHTANITTIAKFISEQEHAYPDATGALSSILYNIVLAGKVIWREVSRAGLVNIIGATDAASKNTHGETQQKLDVFANKTLTNFVQQSADICMIGSEEEEGFVDVSLEYPHADYVVVFDPLDGSSNIEANVSIGTIFSVYKKDPHESEQHKHHHPLLQKGLYQVAAGYILYGSSTMLVYSTGRGTNGFTLDPSIGEFLLSHPNITIPTQGNIYSFNGGNHSQWEECVRSYVKWIKQTDPATRRPYTSRYIGSMVADVHRTLLLGGIFGYPTDHKNSGGKLRLVYEANPMAFLIEQAGGQAIDQTGKRILELQPEHLHQRTPVFLGSQEPIEDVKRFLSSPTSR